MVQIPATKRNFSYVFLRVSGAVIVKTFWGASTIVLAAFAIGGPAFSADLPVKAPALAHTKALTPACGPYLAAFGGWNSVNSMSESLGISDDPREIQFNNGYVVGGAVGTCVPGWNWLRIEGELSYRRNNVKNVTVGGEGSIAKSGHISALAVMANAWADFPVTSNVTVHAGGGIGAAHLNLNTDICGPGCSSGQVFAVDGSDTVFAFQLGAGAAWHVMPSLAFTVDYRYFQAVDSKFNGTSNSFNVTSFTFGHDYQSHSVMVGLRKFFAGP